MMDKNWSIIIIIILALVLTSCGGRVTPKKNFNYNGPIKLVINMFLRSPDFLNNENIPNKYSCHGDNINPELQIVGIPTKTESLALIVDDPSATIGEWTHWLVWNISPTTVKIKENSVPADAVEGINDYNIIGWSGPCPLEKRHKYNFTIYALDSQLNLNSFSHRKDLIMAMENHVIQQAQLSGYYKKP